MKKQFRIFPDHCSSGIWGMPPDHVNYDEFSVRDAVPEILLVALRYWHWIWEVRGDNMSAWSEMRFEQDGQRIVDAMNAAQEKYEFIYVKSF